MEEEDTLLHNILELFQNQVLWCAVAAWFIAQAMKILQPIMAAMAGRTSHE